jgi:hypothetical protein
VSKVLKRAALGALAVVSMATALPAAAETPSVTAADRGPCRDPWINYAYRTQFSRQPVGRGDAGECSIYLYAGGAWQNYDQLRDGVKSFVGATSNAGASIQSVGSIFQFVNRATGGRLNVFIRTASGGLFDVNGAPKKTYRLLATDKQVDLGNGSTLIFSQ